MQRYWMQTFQFLWDISLKFFIHRFFFNLFFKGKGVGNFQIMLTLKLMAVELVQLEGERQKRRWYDGNCWRRKIFGGVGVGGRGKGMLESSWWNSIPTLYVCIFSFCGYRSVLSWILWLKIVFILTFVAADRVVGRGKSYRNIEVTRRKK